MAEKLDVEKQICVRMECITLLIVLYHLDVSSLLVI